MLHFMLRDIMCYTGAQPVPPIQRCKENGCWAQMELKVLAHMPFVLALVRFRSRQTMLARLHPQQSLSVPTCVRQLEVFIAGTFKHVSMRPTFSCL